MPHPFDFFLSNGWETTNLTAPLFFIHKSGCPRSLALGDRGSQNPQHATLNQPQIRVLHSCRCFIATRVGYHEPKRATLNQPQIRVLHSCRCFIATRVGYHEPKRATLNQPQIRVPHLRHRFIAPKVGYLQSFDFAFALYSSLSKKLTTDH